MRWGVERRAAQRSEEDRAETRFTLGEPGEAGLKNPLIGNIKNKSMMAVKICPLPQEWEARLELTERASRAVEGQSREG